METFEVDIDPAQVVRWVMAERRTAPSSSERAQGV